MTDEANEEEIQAAYNRLKEYYAQSQDPNMKIYFDDLTLAYNTLINKASRLEYDDYIASHRKLSSMWEKKRSTDNDDDEEA